MLNKEGPRKYPPRAFFRWPVFTAPTTGDYELPGGFAVVAPRSTATATIATTAATKAATVIIATTTTTAATKTTAATTAAEAAAIRTFFARAGLVDIDPAAFDVRAIERLDGGLSFACVWHFNKAKPARLLRHPVFDHSGRRDRAKGLKRLADVLLSRIT